MKDSRSLPRELEVILYATADAFDMPTTSILARDRHKSPALARQCVFWLSQQLTPQYSSVEIGRHFGRDHATVLHARENFARLARERADIAELGRRALHLAQVDLGLRPISAGFRRVTDAMCVAGRQCLDRCASYVIDDTLTLA